MIEKNTGHVYNSVLCNYYENAKDGVQWHSDDEYSLGTHPVIASLSLGATRKFQIRKKPEYVSIWYMQKMRYSGIVMTSIP